MLVAQNLGRRHFEIPDETNPGKHSQKVIGRIDLPPAETLAHTTLISMVIIVPALPHRENRQKPVVAGIVPGHVAFASAHMRK